jgi:hypothetical protein
VNPTVPLPSLSSIWGRAPDDLFVTTVGTIFRVSGDSWEVSLSDPAANFEAVWGSGVADVFAVGNQGTVAGSEGTIAHWDGRSWAQMPWSTTQELRGVWGTEPNDVYAVGTEGAIVHWDGRSWSAMSSGTTTTLNAVGGTGPNDVYAVGYDGTIVHWNGRDWSPLESGVKANLFAVGAGGRGDVFICGDQSLLHARAGTFEPMNLPTTTICSGLAVTPRQVIAVGYGVTLLEHSTVTCVGPERYCDDGWDNDCDGLVDGADPDCAGKAFEHCANLVDDDGDGLVDCADPDCASFPGCGGRP